ncbi:MAG: S8 family serine peptidase, partial [Hafnia sp.]
MSRKRIELIAFMTLVFLFTAVAAYDVGAAGNDDPFAAMYDSDAVFLEEAAPILEAINHELAMQPASKSGDDQFLQDSFTDPIYRENTPDSTQSTASEAGVFLFDEKALAQAVANNEYELSAWADELLPGTYELLTDMYEQSRTDRFIVKYKDGGSSRSLQDIAAVSIDQTYVLSAAQARGWGEFMPAESRPILECIVLDEKVNPAEFAQSLKAAGLAAEIEYIQPDFILSYAGLGLTYYEVDEEDDNPLYKDNDADAGSGGDILPEEEQPAAEEPEEALLEELPVEEIEREEIVVALLDTGVDIWHPALSDAIVDGWNFVDDSPYVYDADEPYASAHGTHIAGIIAQNSDEYVRIMPLQVFGSCDAYTSDIVAAIACAEEQGARIVNCSFGSGSYNRALEEAMEESDMLFVAAAGNARSDLTESPVYPAAFGLDNIISVASLNADSGFSYYSNYSDCLVDIAARGRDVKSALPEGEYGLQSGTSMSAGFVTAAAAMVLTQNCDYEAEDTKELLVRSGGRLDHLRHKVADARALNADMALAGEYQFDYLYPDYEDDFDVHGYAPTSEESWALFSDKTVVKLAAGDVYTLALCDDGTVWGWGRNDCGQLGNGEMTYETTPVQSQAGFWEIIPPAPEPTTIAFGESEYAVVIPAADTRTISVQAQVKDQTGVPMDVAITYSLADPYPGVSIDSVTGVMTGSAEAQPGSITIVATYEGLSARVDLILLREKNLLFSAAAYSVQLPGGSQTATITATVEVRDEYSEVMTTEPGDIHYALAAHYPGVSIDSVTGVVTVSAAAQPGSVTVVAAYGGLTANVQLTIGTRIAFSEAVYTATLPSGDDETQITVSAVVFDDNGEVMETAPGEITYALAEACAGVSIDSITGVVTINAEAEPGTVTIIASYQDWSASAELVLTNLSLNNLTINTVAGKQYDIVLYGSSITSFSDMEIALKYDGAIFDVVDL